MECPPDEVRYHISVPSGYLSWSVYVEESTNHYGQVIHIMEIVAVQLPEQLGNLIGSVKMNGHEILLQWQRGLASIDRTSGRGKDKLLHFT